MNPTAVRTPGAQHGRKRGQRWNADRSHASPGCRSGAALLTIGLKAGAYLLTGSVGLLSDALIALTVAARPPDEEHAYRHDKVEYFPGAGFEPTGNGYRAVAVKVEVMRCMSLYGALLGLFSTVLTAFAPFVVCRY